MKQMLYSNLMERRFRLIPKYLSKYASFVEDAKSLFNYYILKRRSIPLPELTHISIVPSTICNGNCVFCAKCKLKDTVEIMTFDMFKDVADQYIGNFGDRIYLTPTIGESLIDPNFFDKVRYLKDRGIWCELYTNAILLGDSMEKVFDSGLDKICIDLADIIPEFESSVFRITNEVAKKKIESIITFIEEAKKRESNIIISLNFRSMRTPHQIIKDMKGTPFMEYYKDKEIEFSFLQSYDNWGGLVSSKDLLGIQTLKRPPKVKKYPCRELKTVSILPNGNIRLCGCRCLETMNDELVIGNIKDTSLKELGNNKKWKKLMEGFKDGEMPDVCRNCSFYRPEICSKNTNKANNFEVNA